MKSMSLEKIVNFINEETHNIHIDSFSALVSCLDSIPGIKTIKLKEDKSILKKLTKLFSSNNGKAPKGITLETKHYIHDHSVDTDYEIGFYDEKPGRDSKSEWIALGWGWYNDFVGMSTESSEIPEPEEATSAAPPRIYLPDSIPVADPIQ
ncbi:hypothetical protein IKG06_01425 [Candidatus Saccharibacteria bacterium]|nr:hypothetical protein [Candidatus Saccharibacteria bacterium]